MRRFLLAALLCAAATGCSVVGRSPDQPVGPYRVQEGDTLFDIASAYNLDLDTVIEVNKLENPDRLEVGQIIYLPASTDFVRYEAPKSVLPPVPTVGDVNFIQASAGAPMVGKLIWPVAGGSTSSGFGDRERGFHEGIDIRARSGTPVYAAHDGVVAFSGDEWNGYGNMIVIKGGGLYSVYAHNSKNFVRTGDEVKGGDQIAAVGRTGNATGCHLHFEVRVDDADGMKVAVNPLVFIKGLGTPPARQREEQPKQVKPAPMVMAQVDTLPPRPVVHEILPVREERIRLKPPILNHPTGRY